MKINLYTDDLAGVPAPLVAVGVFSDEPDRGLAFSALNQKLDGALEDACREEDFKGRPGQKLVLSLPKGQGPRRVVVLGLGERKDYGAEGARRFAGAAVRSALDVGAASAAVQLALPDTATQTAALAVVQGMAEGIQLGTYKFTELRSEKGREPALGEMHLAFVAEDVQGLTGAELRAAVARGEAVAKGVAKARDLVNLPANVLTPVELADHAKRMAKKHDLVFKALTPREMEKQGMHLHLGVAKGSTNEPRLIHLTYTPAEKTSDRVICLVGKGLTFDAGGLSIKTSEGMMTMKIDMGGAASVMGTMEAIARSKPGCVVHGVIGAAENMPDGNAIRPGDVIKGKKGISVEILNTDAEGRLVLADALAYAQDLRPTEIIDLATLTGACMVALGPLTAAVYARDEAMFDRLYAAYKETGELFWRMPLQAELRDQLDSDIADIKNIGDRYGGSITAALFLSEFVDKSIPWTHLDVAGPVWATKPGPYTPKGGTGFGVRTLVSYLHQADQGS